MDPQLIKELAVIFGPTGVVLAVFLTERFQGKKEAADPLHDLAEELRMVQRDLAAVRETIAGMKATLDMLKERGK